MQSNSILIGDELAQFEGDPYRVRRSVRRRQTSRAAAADADLHLDILVKDELPEVERHSRARGRAVKVDVVTVADGDGMSWSATEVERAAAEAATTLRTSSKPRLVCFRGKASFEGEPEILQVMKAKRLVRLAQKHKVTASFPLLRPWVKAAIVVTALVVSALVSLYLEASTPSGVTPAQLVSPSYFAMALLLAGLGLVAQWAASPRTDRHPVAMEGLGKELRDKRQAEGYWELVDSVADWLRGAAIPRVLIVDGYDRLHPFTCDVLERYLDRYVKAALGYELWVIFENREIRRFDKLLQEATLRGAPWTQSATVFEQQFLGDEQRLRLAEQVNNPQGRDLHSVKAIRGKDVDHTDDYQRRFDEHRLANPASDRRYGALELFYLLALASEGIGNPRFSDRSITDRLSPKKPIRVQVLGQLLEGTQLQRGEFTSTLSGLQDAGLSAFIEVDERTREFRISPGARQYLARHHRAYSLPDPRLGHLFWALLCRDIIQEPATQMFWVQKLATHLLAAREPDGIPVDEPLPQQVKDEFFKATLDAVKACLRCCLLEDVPRLLRLAESLVRSREPGTGRNWRTRLLEVAWAAYSVLPDEDVLGVVIELRSQRQRLAAVETQDTPADPLDELFLASLSLPDRDRQTQRELALAWSQAGEPAQTYGRARAFWLARILGGFLHGVEPKLRAAAAVDVEELLPAVERSLERAHQPGQRVAVDVIGASVGLWALMVALADLAAGLRSLERQLRELPEELLQQLGADPAGLASVRARHAARVHSFVALLETGLIVADDLDRASQDREAMAGLGAGGDPDFLLDVLAKELFVVLSACAASLLSAHSGLSDQAFGATARANAAELVEAGLTAVGADVPPLGRSRPSAADADVRNRIEHQMGLLRVVWTSLGLDQLSALVGLRLAQFRIVRAAAGGAGGGLGREMIDDLIAERTRRDFIGVLANALVAKAKEGVGETHALAIGHAVDAALDAGFGSELATELCLVAIGESHSHPIPLDRFLGHLVRGDGASSSNLAALLSGLPDGLLPTLALWLLNAVRSSERRDLRPALAKDVAGGLASRAESISDPQVKDEVHQQIELSELEDQLDRNEPVDHESTIDAWKERAAGTANYAFMLYILLAGDQPAHERVVDEATSCLKQDQSFKTNSASVLLARRLSVALNDRRLELDPAREQAAFDVLVTHLKKAHPIWVARLPIETNLRLLSMLQRRDPANASAYREQYILWDVRRHERDREQRLALLAQQGDWFLLFKHYYEVLAIWSLPADRPPDELLDRLRSDQETLSEEFEAWERRGRRVPQPFAGATGLTLSSDFLVYGHCLFQRPYLGRRDLDGLRGQFNQAARKGLRSLYDQITSLASIPQPIRMALASHRDSLLDSALPRAAARAASRVS